MVCERETEIERQRELCVLCVYVVCAPRHSRLVVAAALAPPRPALSLPRPLPVLAPLLSVLLDQSAHMSGRYDFNRLIEINIFLSAHTAKRTLIIQKTLEKYLKYSID